MQLRQSCCVHRFRAVINDKGIRNIIDNYLKLNNIDIEIQVEIEIQIEAETERSTAAQCCASGRSDSDANRIRNLFDFYMKT